MSISLRISAIGVGAIEIAALVLSAVAPAGAQQKRPITFKDLAAMHRLSDPQLSPDGKWIAYEVGTPNLEANHVAHDIWLVPWVAAKRAHHARRERHAAAMVAGWKAAHVFVLTRGRAASLLDHAGWRRREPAYVAFRWRGQSIVVARRKMDRVHIERLSRIARTRLAMRLAQMRVRRAK